MVFVFGDHELDGGLFQLRRVGRVVVIQPKVLSALLYLVRNRDRVVAKEELLEALWPDAIDSTGVLHHSPYVSSTYESSFFRIYIGSTFAHRFDCCLRT